jgi:hypothetical protein
VGIGSSDNWVEDLDWIEGDEDIDEVLSGVAVDDDGKVRSSGFLTAALRGSKGR